MSDVLAYVRKRKAELLQELNDLETAERVILEATGPEDAATQSLAEGSDDPSPDGALLTVTIDASKWVARPKTIKEMVLRLLTEANPSGLTALEILAGIHKKWMPALERTSLSPQLTRLKNDALVVNRVGKWFVAEAISSIGRSVEYPASVKEDAPHDGGALDL